MDPFSTWLLLSLGAVIGWCACKSVALVAKQRKAVRR